MEQEQTPRTTDDFAKYGIRAIIRDRAHKAVDASIEALAHIDIIRLAEAHGIAGTVVMALEAASIAAEFERKDSDRAARARLERELSERPNLVELSD